MNFNEKREFFTGLLANPAHIQKLHSTELEILIQEYPYSNILHAFLASSHSKTLTQEFENKLHLASAYATDRNVLFKLINKPELLTDPTQVTIPSSPAISEENEDLSSDYIEDFLEDSSIMDEPEIAEEAPITLEAENINQVLNGSNPDDLPEEEEDVYDEIVAIEDIEINPVATTETLAPSEPIVEKDELDLATEKLILGAGIASDYLAFNDHRQKDKTEQVESPAIPVEPAPLQENSLISLKSNPTEQQRVSKYHDEKMPYSFTWWLDKTRREYAGTYQPYVNYAPARQEISKKGAAELQHQYIENIFHLNTIEDLEQHTSTQTIEFDMHRKEDQIIERFIKEEPQIKPPSGDKLDTENKARKSSEDSDELVTETLARIYVDQMLYHKAADTYKKLALKFPEKSRYFASQIELLERKLN